MLQDDQIQDVIPIPITTKTTPKQQNTVVVL